ncbi:MAG: R3H domain-containing nucleic acid-binding protein [Atopobiaceae bacterium]|nr:R3H domain-containing nucleic acid-binding protein [Atopobiaceae bacterium]
MDEVINDSVEKDEKSEQVVSSDAFAEIRAAYEANEELSDDQLDAVADLAVGVIRDVLKCFGETESTIDEYDGDEGELILDVNGGDLAVLIGRHGRVLDALQLVISSIVSKRLGFHFPIVVDIEGYKNRRKQKIQTIARSAASRAKRSGKVRLKPMNAYERRLVHLALIDDADVTTHSEGEDPERYVVITAVRGE